MTISYNKLFKLLIDRRLKKKDLCELSKISASTLSKMGRNEMVSMDVIVRICLALNCSMDDILEILPDRGEAATH